MTPAVRHGLDPDFASEVLEDLYAYRRKRKVVAFAFWVVLGWLGGHRFYLERPVTGLLMLLTGGGALIWWIVDAWRIPVMVREHNAEQARRQEEGRPPLELAFMPPAAPDVLHTPAPWTVKWRQRGRLRRALRFGGDLLVLMVAGSALGSLAGVEGGTEAAFAVVALIAVTLLGGDAPWLDRIPLARALVRWSHRLRLFYYYNPPGPPPALLVRGATAVILAPFRRRDRAEVRLYLELGAVFTLAFVGMDVLEDVAVPLVRTGTAALSVTRLAGVWIQEAFMTFLVTYAFAAPVGAVLTLHLLTRRTHTVPRLLGVFALFTIALGAGVI